MNLAIIDATAGEPGPSLCLPPASRYAMPIANVPLIGHVLDELSAGGITQARIVADPRVRGELLGLLGAACRGVELTFLEAAEPEGPRTVLAEAARALSSRPVLLHPGDSLFRSRVAAVRERFAAGDVDSVIVAGQLQSQPGHPPAPTVAMLGRGARPAVEQLLSQSASESHDLLAPLLRADLRLAVCEPGRQWRYGESTEALLAANRMVLDELPDDAEPASLGAGNRVHGRIAVHPRARISDCVLHGPIAIDQGAVLEDSYIGPYTAIGADAIVSGAEIDNAMVLPEAEIRHPGCRLEGSIIGHRARVTRSFALPKGLHVRLGPGSQLEIS